VAVKRSANFLPVVFSAGVALIASLVAIVLTSDTGTLLYLVGVATLGTLALLLWIALRRGRQQRIMSVAAVGAFLIVTAGVVFSQSQIVNLKAQDERSTKEGAVFWSARSRDPCGTAWLCWSICWSPP